MGPRELAYYAYSDDIARHVGSDSRVARIKQYGDVGEAQDDEGLPRSCCCSSWSSSWCC